MKREAFMIAFSPRERQIVELRAAGLAYKEIGYRLHLTTKTVKFYMNCCRKRLGYASPAELTAEFVRRERLDYMRVMALEILAWLRQYEKKLSAPARAAMEKIMAESVKEI